MRRWSVKDVMSKDVITVAQTTPYKEIVETLARHGVSAVPVLSPAGRVVGVVSEADVLHKMEFAGLDEHVHLFERKRRRVGRVKATGETAADLMTEPVISVEPAASIAVAAKLMDDENVKRLPVIDAEGRLMGIVSRGDLLRVYLRDDDAIRAEVEDQVLLRSMWIEPGTVAVTVDRGVVSLSGTVDRRSTIAIVVRLVSSVPGVVEVIDNLTYHYDDRVDRRGRHPTSADVLSSS